MKKIMVINWKWENFPKEQQNLIYHSKDDELIITRFSKDQVEQFNKKIESIIEEKKPNEILVLTHNNPVSNIKISKDLVPNLSDDNLVMRVREFKGGDDHIYYANDLDEGILNDTDLTKKDAIIIKNFDESWDYYWNKLELEYLKKQIINLWHPLAIDIQGLNEVKNKKKESYYNEIKKGFKNDNNEKSEYCKKLNSFPDENELPRWKEIKNELNDEYKNFNPADLIKEISGKTYSDFDKDYLNKENPNFLPNWLQEVVSILDDKINPSDVKK